MRGPGRPLLTLALQYPVTMAPYPYLTLTLALTNQARDCSRASARAYLFVGPSLSPSSVEFSRALASRNQFTTPSYTVASCRLPGEPGGRTSPLRTHTVTPRPHLCFHVPGRVRDFDKVYDTVHEGCRVYGTYVIYREHGEFREYKVCRMYT